MRDEGVLLLGWCHPHRLRRAGKSRNVPEPNIISFTRHLLLPHAIVATLPSTTFELLCQYWTFESQAMLPCRQIIHFLSEFKELVTA